MKNSGSALSAVKKNYASVITRTQSLANPAATAIGRRALGPGQSFKHQASSPKLREHQATSVKPQAASVKLKPASVKLHDS